MSEVDEIFLDFPDMANRPTSVYAARVKGVDNTGKPYTRTRLFIRKATMETMVARFKEYAGPGYEVETFEGEIVWSDKVKAKEKKARKKKGQESGEKSEDAKPAPSIYTAGVQFRSADEYKTPPVNVEMKMWEQAGQDYRRRGVDPGTHHS